mmetsp:Transcript_48664/g.156282  ORF Transcript_48664/g.156282 Transcript_48664/m.156282 type:complete len:211 (+) Transcript_48664:13-645(+)
MRLWVPMTQLRIASITRSKPNLVKRTCAAHGLNARTMGQLATCTRPTTVLGVATSEGSSLQVLLFDIVWRLHLHENVALSCLMDSEALVQVQNVEIRLGRSLAGKNLYDATDEGSRHGERQSPASTPQRNAEKLRDRRLHVAKDQGQPVAAFGGRRQLNTKFFQHGRRVAHCKIYTICDCAGHCIHHVAHGCVAAAGIFRKRRIRGCGEE